MAGLMEEWKGWERKILEYGEEVAKTSKGLAAKLLDEGTIYLGYTCVFK